MWDNLHGVNSLNITHGKKERHVVQYLKVDSTNKNKWMGILIMCKMEVRIHGSNKEIRQT